jgi:hypothetical protein
MVQSWLSAAKRSNNSVAKFWAERLKSSFLREVRTLSPGPSPKERGDVGDVAGVADVGGVILLPHEVEVILGGGAGAREVGGVVEDALGASASYIMKMTSGRRWVR